MEYMLKERFCSGILSEKEMKYNIKDSVFRRLFSMPKFRLELYRSLFPDDMDVKEEELRDVTITNFLINGQHNDIAFKKGNELLIMIEAQDTWSVNIMPRMQLYRYEIMMREIKKDKRLLFSSRKAELPHPKYYVIYTGSNKSVKDSYSLSEEFGYEDDEDMRVTVLKRGLRRGDIVDQYIDFSNRIHDIIKKKGIRNVTIEDLEEVMEGCIRDGILAEFLSGRIMEVIDLMRSIFNEEYYLKCKVADGYDEGMAEGIGIGEAKGKKQGRIEERITMAREFLKAGTPINVVSSVTGFKPDYIRSLV